MSSQSLLHLQKRPTTPDSACEQDWAPRPGMDTDLSDTSCSTNKNHHNKLYGINTAGGVTNDSDGDSGIVTVRHSQRTGSTSSTDTETSQENTSRNLSTLLLENHYNVVLRKGLKGSAQSNGPLKGDHSILTSNNNPAKLSIFQPKDQTATNQQLVRFDDELHLTEQSIRRSCRKLFAALYAQKHSGPESHMSACQHRISVNIPVTSSSYPCCRTSGHPTFQRSLSNQDSSSHDVCNTSRSPIKTRSNSVSEPNRQGSSDVYEMCQNIYSRKNGNPEMVKVFARPAAVIPMIAVQSSANAVPSSDSNGQCELQTVDHNKNTVPEVTTLATDSLSKEVNKENESCRSSDDFSNYQSTSQVLRVTLTTPKSVSMPQLQDQNGSDLQQKSQGSSEVEYAVVDKTKKLRKNEPHAISYPCLSRSMCDAEEPPVPPKKFLHRSDFALYQGPNAKKTFLGRIHGFTKSAKSAIQKAFSTERIYRPHQEEELDVSGRKKHVTFIKGLKNRVSMKNKKKTPNVETVRIESTSSSPLWGIDGIDGPRLDHVCGQLIQLNVDGSQVIELTRPHGKPFGFFVARGRVKNSRGVFVSRMGDANTQKLLSGLVDVGDEILEIDGFNVQNSDILEVNGLMAKKLTLLLTILPYICRKDI